MADLINFEQFTNKYSDNVLSYHSLLKNSPTISFVGDGTYTIEDDELDYSLHSNSFVYDSGLVDEITGTDIAFNFGDALKYHSLTNQKTLFQFSVNPKLINLNAGVTVAPVTLKVNVYSGVVLLDTFETIVDLKLLEGNRHYTFGFLYNVPRENDVNFTFEINNAGFGVPKGRYIFAFSGFKVELDNRDIGIPTPYSVPVYYYIPNSGTTTQKVTGNIEMASGLAPTLAQHLVTKDYVDASQNQTQSQRSTATTGTESVTDNGKNTVFIHDAIVTPTLTVNLPSAPVNNQIVTLVSVLGITTLTLATLLGSIVGGVTSLTAGVSVRYIWMASQNKWFRI